MPRLQPKSISIDACDDLFDTDDEGGGTSEDHHEEEEVCTSNRIKKSELIVGALVNARDSSVNDTKYGSGVRKQSYTAFIVEPGISDDGMYHIPKDPCRHLIILPLLLVANSSYRAYMPVPDCCITN